MALPRLKISYFVYSIELHVRQANKHLLKGVPEFLECAKRRAERIIAKYLKQGVLQ